MKRIIGFIAFAAVFSVGTAIVGSMCSEIGAARAGEVGFYLGWAVGFALMVCDSLLIVWGIHAFRNNDWFGAGVAAATLICVAPFVMSLDATFWAEGVADKQAAREAASKPSQVAEFKTKQLGWVEQHRPVGVVQADLKAHQARYKGLDDNWADSKRRWQRNAYEARINLEKELATARYAATLIVDEDLTNSKVVGEADPLSATMARTFGGNKETWLDVRLLWFPLVMLLMQVATAYFAFHKPNPPKEPEAKANGTDAKQHESRQAFLQKNKNNIQIVEEKQKTPVEIVISKINSNHGLKRVHWSQVRDWALEAGFDPDKINTLPNQLRPKGYTKDRDGWYTVEEDHSEAIAA